MFTTSFVTSVHFILRLNANCWRNVKNPEMDECILSECEDNSRTSTTSIALTTDVCKTTVWKILHQEGLFPYHLQRTQILKVDYPKCIDFCHLFLSRVHSLWTSLQMYFSQMRPPLCEIKFLIGHFQCVNYLYLICYMSTCFPEVVLC